MPRKIYQIALFGRGSDVVQKSPANRSVGQKTALFPGWTSYTPYQKFGCETMWRSCRTNSHVRFCFFHMEQRL